MSWLVYENQGATRNKPLSDNLVSALSFLPEMGVTMQVISGGQDAIGEGDRRTGSTRHDHGNAADADFYMNGRKLDWNNPDDVPIFQEIVKRARANGVTGIGAGDDYMGAGRVHIGFGNEAVWGAGGKGENAPDWLRTAYGGGSHVGHNHVPSDHSVQQEQPFQHQPPTQNALARQPEPETETQNALYAPAYRGLDPRQFMSNRNRLAAMSFDQTNPYLRALS